MRNSQATLRFFSSDKDPFENIKTYLRFSLFFLQAAQASKFYLYTMRTNLPKLSDLLIFCIYSLNSRLEFFIMIFFVTNQLNILKSLIIELQKRYIIYLERKLRIIVFQNWGKIFGFTLKNEEKIFSRCWSIKYKNWIANFYHFIFPGFLGLIP